MRSLSALELIALLVLGCADDPAPLPRSSPGEPWLAEALALVPHVVAHGCRPSLRASQAHPFREATAACDVYLGAEITSAAIDREERAQAAEALAALFEWPRGIDRPADAVSGPIVGGYGVGASALAISASRALPDDHTHRELVRAADDAGIAMLRDDPRELPLENAIYLFGRAARPWVP